MNGAEIMDSMESGSRGFWRPSPGSVYPMLQHLADEGLISRRDSDGRYEITPQGREEAEWPSRMQGFGPKSVEGILGDISSNISYLEDLARSKNPELLQSTKSIRELANRMTKLSGEL
jgi:DNA-binding PadR family transcriptional regulator